MKYHGKLRTSRDKFRVRRDIYKFEKLARKHKRDFEKFVVSNLVRGRGYTWVGELDTQEAEENFILWKRVNEALRYNFQADIKCLLAEYYNTDYAKIFLTNEKDLPMIVKSYIRGQTNFETAAIVYHILGTDNQIENVLWDDIETKIIKYRNWMPEDLAPFKKILLTQMKERTCEKISD